MRTGETAPCRLFGAALPALHRAVARAARDGDAEARYACACFIEQILADTAACRAAPASAHTLLDEVRQAGAALARDFATDRGPSPAGPWAEFLERAMTAAVAHTEALWRSGAARGDTRTEALLRHATDWKTPECYAYDLADPRLVHAQATGWLAELGRRTAVFVVGVRTGGSYLAPLWAAAVAAAGREAAPWTTVRPLRRDGKISLCPAETDRLPPALPEDTVIVAVDDQPDTGDTARAVWSLLAGRFPRVRDIVLVSPGRAYRVDAARVDAARVRPVVAPTPKGTGPVRTDAARLWQLLGDPGRLIARARSRGILPPDGPGYRLAPFRGPFHQTHGPGTDPAGSPAGPGPHRISPRSRPFSLLPDDPRDGRAHHFRFIGTGPHGAQCAQVAEELAEFLPPVRHYLDGYLVTAQEPGLRPLGPGLTALTAGQRRMVWSAVVRYWRGLEALGDLGAVDPAVGYDPRERLGSALDRLRGRLSRPLPVDNGWLDRQVPRRAALGGRRGRLFRTSLPYAHQGWHWQVRMPGGPDGPPAVRRFGLDWIWGGTGCLESEIASFVVENRLDDGCLRELRAALDDDPVFDAGLDLAGEALYWPAKTWLRRCPAPGEDTARRITATLEDLAHYVSGLH